MATFHISEAAAARDFAGLLERVRAGSEVVIDSESFDKTPVVVAVATEMPRGRLLSESLALAKAAAEERGYDLVMDEDFAADMREIIANRKPRDTSAWD